MLIVSFVSRPRVAAETRQMVHGITYAMRWDFWGFTWGDMAEASSYMVQPWTYLRALGLYKPKDASWGLDYITAGSMRAANYNNGFTTKGVAKAEITWLPKFLRLTKDEIDDNVTNAWFWFCNDQIKKLVNFFKNASLAGLLVYISVFSLVDMTASQDFVSSLFGSVRRLALVGGIVAGITYMIRESVESTQWAKDLRKRRRFFGAMKNQAFFDEVKEGPHAVPNPFDILIENRYGNKDLGAYNDYIDYHVGNSDFLELVDLMAPSYATYPEFFRDMSAKHIVETLIVDDFSGRFLEQGQQGRWHVADLETAIYFAKKTLASRSMRLFGTILKETRHLISVMRYGIYRNDDIAILSGSFLKDLTTKFLDAGIGKKSAAPPTAGLARPTPMEPLYGEDGVTALRWKEPVRNDQKPIIKKPSPVSSAPASRAKHVPRKPRKNLVVPKEPKEGAWIVSGEMVEGNVDGYWYVGKVEQITAHGNHLIKFGDGDEGFYDEYQIRRPVPFAVGDPVQVLVEEPDNDSEDDDDSDNDRIFDNATIVSIEKSGDITVEIEETTERRTVASTKLRRKIVGQIRKKPEHSYNGYG